MIGVMVPEPITRDQARQYFKDCGLSYQDINLRALRYLELELNDQFSLVTRAGLEGRRKKPLYWVRVNPAKYYKGKYDPLTGTLTYAFLTAKGTYFSARDVVSFQSDGFISFASEADDENVQPVLAAFLLWCDWLKRRKEEQP